MTLKSIWCKVRKHYPQRIYQSGLCGFRNGMVDDRSLREKLFDRIDEWFVNRDNKIRDKKARANSRFRPFFDWSEGEMVNSLQDIKDKEAKGQVWISVREVDKIRKEKDKYREQLREKDIQKGIENIIRDVKQGRKFTVENRMHREKCLKEMGVNS